MMTISEFFLLTLNLFKANAAITLLFDENIFKRIIIHSKIVPEKIARVEINAYALKVKQKYVLFSTLSNINNIKSPTVLFPFPID